MKRPRFLECMLLFVVFQFLTCTWAPGQQAEPLLSFSLPSIIALSSSLVADDHEAALSAAWARVLSASSASMTAEMSRPKHRFSSPSLNQFFGFVEGRLRVVTPSTWQSSLASAELLSNGLVRFPIAPVSAWTPLDGDSAFELHIARQGARLRLSKRTGNIASLGNPGSALLPDAFSADLITQVNQGELPVTDALFFESHLFVVVVSTDSPEGRIHCFHVGDPSALKVVWVSEALTFGSAQYQGNTNWFTQLRVSKGSLLAFSCSSEQATIHQIDFESGRAVKLHSTRSPTLQTPRPRTNE